MHWMGCVYLQSNFSSATFIWLLSSWSVRRDAARRPFLASLSCCCKDWISLASCPSRSFPVSISFRIRNVASSMSEPLSKWESWNLESLYQFVSDLPLWNCSRTHWRFVSAAWCFCSRSSAALILATSSSRCCTIKLYCVWRVSTCWFARIL